MQAFNVQVVSHVQGHRPYGDVFAVTAKNEEHAALLAQLQARDKYPGALPLVRGIRIEGCPFEQDPSKHPMVQPKDEAAPTVVRPSTEDNTEGLRDYDAPVKRTYAEWKAMHWKSVVKFASHAVRGREGEVPTTRDEAMVILQERGLVAP